MGKLWKETGFGYINFGSGGYYKLHSNFCLFAFLRPKSGKIRQKTAKSVNSCSHTVCRVFWHDIFAFLAKIRQNTAKSGKIRLNLSRLSKLWQICLHRSTHFLQEYLVWQFCLHGQNSAKSGKIRLNLSRLSKWWQKCLHRSKHKLVWQFCLHDQNMAKSGKIRQSLARFYLHLQLIASKDFICCVCDSSLTNIQDCWNRIATNHDKIFFIVVYVAWVENRYSKNIAKVHLLCN